MGLQRGIGRGQIVLFLGAQNGQLVLARHQRLQLSPVGVGQEPHGRLHHGRHLGQQTGIDGVGLGQLA